MPQAITIPRLGWSMEQGVFVGWLKSAGDPVRLGDPLFTLEGEKAVQEIEAVDAGTLCIPPNAPQVGDTVIVSAVIGYLLAEGEVAPSEIPPTAPPIVAVTMTPPQPTLPLPTNTEPPKATSSPAASPAVRRLARELGVSLANWNADSRVSENDVRLRAKSKSVMPTRLIADVPRRQRGLPAISPRAARIAADLGVDWTGLRGTGNGQRIREADVRRAVSDLRSTVDDTTDAIRGKIVPAPRLRQTIAERLTRGWQQTVPVTLTSVVDANVLVELRRRWKTEGREVIPTVTDIMVSVVATALSLHPLLKARWRGTAWEIPDGTNIGLAVDTPDGLLVPVVRDVNTLSLTELAQQTRDLAERARLRRLKPDELRGGVFTVTNLGAFGVDGFTPILNFPESAILGLGAIRREAVVTSNNHVVPADRMTLSLTFDHRALDGAPAARFLQTVCEELQRLQLPKTSC